MSSRLSKVSLFKVSVPLLFTEMPSWVAEVTAFDCELPKLIAVEAVASVKLELTVIAPLEPPVAFARLRTTVVPEVITLAVTPTAAAFDRRGQTGQRR